MIAIAQDDAQDFPQILRLYRREGGEFDAEAAPGSNSGDAREGQSWKQQPLITRSDASLRQCSILLTTTEDRGSRVDVGWRRRFRFQQMARCPRAGAHTHNAHETSI
jgi:hypothetical protein